MGHIKSGGAAANEDPLAADSVWPLWRALVREFGLWCMVVRLSRSFSGWGLYGVDVISTLGDLPWARRALATLRDLPEVQLERLARLAELNARRNEAHWRMAALFYITVPASLFVAGLQGAPEYTRAMVSDLGPWVTLLILGVVVQMLYYFATQWRARQVEAVIELARIERLGPPAAPTPAAATKGKRSR
ncbi:MAG: hypothetical protein ACK4FB_14245 [Brevundimonas sp.]|uniref:hypothetical protein n=1 Tax=Brevundimonas sp. TaxID=1871086 RepID=UPI00391C0AD1